MAQKFVVLEEAAKMLGISPEEMKNRLKIDPDFKRLRSFRDGATLRFRLSEIEDLARSSEEFPTSEPVEVTRDQTPDVQRLSSSAGAPTRPTRPPGPIAMPSWPTQSDYKDSLQNPDTAFRDPDLKQSQAERSPMGIPRARSGTFASVYKMTGPKDTVALKLFNFPNEDRAQRYKAVSDYLEKELGPKKPPCVVKFQYHLEGIRVGKGWYPMLTMAWVKGVSLGEWVRQTVERKNPDVAAMKKMAELWVALVQQLQDTQIAHCDLEHDNVMVVNDAPVLVDYDGVCVPALERSEQLEFGKPAYQHPARHAAKLSSRFDNFSAWIILIALRAITAEPQLYTKHVIRTDNENLLFTPNDVTEPNGSTLWPDLMRCKDLEVRDWARMVRESLERPFASIPPFAPNSLGEVARVPVSAREDRPSTPVASAGVNETRHQSTEDRSRLVPKPHDTNSPLERGDPHAAHRRVLPLGTPRTVGRYETLRLLGGGSFGRVYLAFDPEIERYVAVKMPILPPGSHREFLREARIVAQLHHPNICPVYDVGVQNDLPFIVMRYVDGGTLENVLAHGLLNSSKALRIAGQIARGLDAAHARGVFHRDLKPANVLYDEAASELLLTDFGVARWTEGATATTGGIKGTPAFMAPEQWGPGGMFGDISARTDVYSLGVLLFQLLTGAAVFPGTSPPEQMFAHCFTEPRRPSEVRPGLDPRLNDLVLKALAKKPAERHASAREFADAIAAYLRASSPPRE
jgi:tRNA A-37 threonylcarbamoyl transferase component Bud32